MIVERLLTTAIPAKECLASARIVQRKREHPVELLHAIFSPFLIGVNDNFSVRARAEGMSLLDELIVKFDVIIDLSVETNRQGTVLIVDRLPSPIQVDDGESPHAHVKPVRLVVVRTFTVGAPMSQALSHPGQETLLVKTGEAENSAHLKAIRLRPEGSPVKQIDGVHGWD